MTLFNNYNMIIALISIIMVFDDLPKGNARLGYLSDKLLSRISYDLDKNTEFEFKYFDHIGWAAPVKYLLHQLYTKFKEIKINEKLWPRKKPNMPFRHAPVLIIDNYIKLTPSAGLCRFLAHYSLLNGDTKWESYLIDSIVETIEDLHRELKKHLIEKDENKANQLKIHFRDIQLPIFMNKFENIVANNGEYFVNGKLTLADIFFATTIDSVSQILEIDVLKNYPFLNVLTQRLKFIYFQSRLEVLRVYAPWDLNYFQV